MRTQQRWLIVAGLAAFAAIAACKSTAKTTSILAGADPAGGKDAIARYGCPACHTIPGIEGANGMVGPSLDHVATRTMLGGGRIPNTPENMIKWIQHPQNLDQKNLMPELGVTDPDAKNIAAYLYTLK